MRVLCAVGARPNFVKVAPLITALERAGIDAALVHTGQHYDKALDQAMFDDLGLRAPDHHLGVGSDTHARQTAAILTAFEPVLLDVAPDVVLVVGDANSTLACALVAAKCGVAVAHVEAGLRCGDRTMPEEINRILTDQLSDHLFAPSADAMDHLAAEGIPPQRTHLVGNVMIDALHAHLPRARERHILVELGLQPNQYALATMHRPANVDDPAALEPILAALGDLASSMPVILPVHPRARAAVDAVVVPTGVRCIDPVGYLDFLCLEASAAIVVTDSGGVQEETTVLGVRCVTARDSTERPVTITDGTNRLGGRTRASLGAAIEASLAGSPSVHRPPLWDGRAAERVADVLRDLGQVTST